MGQKNRRWPRVHTGGRAGAIRTTGWRSFMGLLTTLLNSSNALQVYDQEFATIQTNIANVDTPGYADQNLPLVADSFDPSERLYGGVSVAPLASTRSEYLEQSVRTDTTQLGTAQQQVSDLTPLQSLFDLSSTTGVSGSL